MKRWFHVTSYTECWGFSIDENNTVIDVSPLAPQLKGKCVKDPTVRKWFTGNNLTVSEVKTYSQDAEVCLADVL